MAVAYRTGVASNNGQTATTSSAAFVIPGAAQIGDTAIVTIASNSAAATYTPPAGWVRISGPDTINSNLHCELWAKDLVSGEPTSTVTFTSSVGARLPGVMSVFSGTSRSALSVALATKTTAATSATSPAVVTSTDGTGIAAFWLLRDNTATPSPTVTVPGTHTARSVAQTDFAASPNYTVQASNITTPGAAGSYGGVTATSTEAATWVIYYVLMPPTLGGAPVASFSKSASSGPAPLPVTFTDTSSNTPTSWAWNFGDGATATTQNPVHSYTSPGTYTVSLTATNASGTNAAATSTVTVTSSAGTGGGMQMYRLASGTYGLLTPYALTT